LNANSIPDTPTPLNEPIEIPDKNIITQPEEYGWSYYSYDEDRGEAYKSLILDKNGINTEIWFVGDHDGDLPNRFPTGWNANIEYNDGILISPNVMIEELNNNQVANNWNISLDIIKRENKGKPITISTTPPYPPGSPEMPGSSGSYGSSAYDPNTPPYPPGSPEMPGSSGSSGSSAYDPNTPPYPPGSPGYAPNNANESYDSSRSPPPPPLYETDVTPVENKIQLPVKREDGIELIINTDTPINNTDASIGNINKNDETTNTADEKKSITLKS